MTVRAWRLAVGQPCADTPTLDVNWDQVALQLNLIREEVTELIDAVAGRLLPDIAKEAADVRFVVDGLCELFGIDPDRAFDAVVRSNFTKLVDGKAFRNTDGKVVKGPGYVPPDMGAVIDAMRVLGRQG